MGSAWIGVIGALLGVVATAMFNTWRERSAWKREDRARSYEHRRAAYMDFMAEWNRLLDAAYRSLNYDNQTVGDVGAEDWLDDLLSTNWLQIQVFGSQEAINFADRAIKALAGYGDGEVEYASAFESMRPFRAAVRMDLGLDAVEDDLLPS